MNDTEQALEALQLAGFAVDPVLFPGWYDLQYLEWKFSANDRKRFNSILIQQPQAVIEAGNLIGALMYFSTTHDAATKWADAIVLTDDNAPPSPLVEVLTKHYAVLEAHQLHGYYAFNYALDWSGQAFTYEDFELDISMGLDIVQGREPDGNVSVSHWLTHPAVNIEVDLAHIQTVDINQPLLAATFPAVFGSTIFLIDGYHRLHRAQQLGVETLKAHVLDLFETYMILRSQMYRPVWMQELKQPMNPADIEPGTVWLGASIALLVEIYDPKPPHVASATAKRYF